MIIVYIYLGISLMTLVLYSLASFDIANKFKIEYPGLKCRKKTFAGTIFSFLKMEVACFVPIMNIGLFWTIVFDYEDLEQRIIDKLYIECVEKGTNFEDTDNFN